ncbi:bacillithiol system redox-active protein YtxJ [uncultured Croceitalea sp.]|uniref:bacillithiol system redox-active protein YtxJ n=1 Tax=uncultured Croceitalea sp. TaxID=1798908 RepID=UPI003305B772
MGLFGGLFGGSSNTEKEEKTVPWINLHSLAQLDKIQEESKGRTQVIFKHSTTCGISRMVLNMFSSGYNLEADQLDLYFLDLHAHRDVSNETAVKFQVIHQSPQLLVIKNGTTVFHASHGAISEVSLEQYV